MDRFCKFKGFIFLSKGKRGEIYTFFPKYVIEHKSDIIRN